MDKQIGVLGSGNVGQALANGLKGLGFEVAIGSRDGHQVDNWQGPVGTFSEIAARADIVILAVKGSAAEEVIVSLKDHLKNKLVIDTTNPISNSPPEDGVLNFFTTFDKSLMERLQVSVPSAHFVKAFNSVGSGNMVKPSYPDSQPTMFICGDDQAAKDVAAEIIARLGWEVEDMGSAKSARAIEPLCILWCIPGIQHNQWSHAFKLLKK